MTDDNSRVPSSKFGPANFQVAGTECPICHTSGGHMPEGHTGVSHRLSGLHHALVLPTMPTTLCRPSPTHCCTMHPYPALSHGTPGSSSAHLGCEQAVKARGGRGIPETPAVDATRATQGSISQAEAQGCRSYTAYGPPVEQHCSMWISITKG